ncbi:kinase-like domain-containing protein [Diplogelasinospora grovesii]|uniref:Kinase-like domain-containing protein n=1 Tax=Diplogelasinospora grovesii TaxID=303347 RepID=A0AAN6NDR5_9PEZI|nr:kinase-like domain-containing protein [Diplogelasinospora grovesii]
MDSPTRRTTEKAPDLSLDTKDISPLSDDMSDDELARIFCTGPVLYEFGSSKVVRLSDDLVIKGGLGMTRGEAETQKFASTLGIRVPAVRRVFRATLPNIYGQDRECWLMVMDFVRGQLLDDIWGTMGHEVRVDVARRVASIIQRLQSTPIKMPPGPVNGSDGEPWHGPFFTHYGAGPFPAMSDLEDWYNHKLDVCIRLRYQSSEAPRFHFDTLVLTHQDIAPRNIIVQEDTGQLVLLDWAMGGIYPPGFEQAALSRQWPGKWDSEFRELVLAELPDRYTTLTSQLKGITYALTTGVFL